jgi:class 3 adenylate cyclase
MMTAVNTPRDPASPDNADAGLRALGIAESAIARAIERGDPAAAIFEAALLPGIADRTVSASGIACRGGLSVEEIRAFVLSFGLRPPDPDEPWFTPEEAEVLVELGTLLEVWPRELNVGVGNVWGPLVRRIAKSGVQRFWGHVEARLRADDPNPFAGLRPVREAFARLLPLSEPVLRFTAFADAEGDAAADSFARIVAEQRGEFLLMKSLGDGAMLVYPEGIAAVSAAARIIEQTRLRCPLPVHAGAHVGAAIARDGDYDGSSVNLAARLLGVAQPDQLIATREVVDRTADSYNWEPLGSQEIRGIGQPVGRLLPAFPGGRIHGPAPLSVVRDVGAQRTWSSRAVSSGSPGSPR